MWLRQSTASQEIKLGKFADSTDGDTAETGLTIANTDIKLTKGGSTTEVNKNSGGATHVAGGRYSAVLDATDTNTLGNLEVDCDVTGALAVHRSYLVVPAVVYDAIVLGTDNLDTNVIQWLGTAVATPTTAGVPEVDTTFVSGTAQTANDNGADINTLLTRIIGTLAAGTHNPASTAQLGVLTDWLNGGRLDLLLDAIPTTPMRGTDGANTTVPDAAGTAATPAQVATALTDIHLDHLLAVDYDPASKPGVATALLNELIESNAGVSRYTAAALNQAPGGGGSGLTAQETRDAMKLAPSGGAAAAESLDEKLDNIETSTAGLAGAAMRGTDNAATEAKQDIIDTLVDSIKVDTGTTIPTNQVAISNQIITVDTEVGNIQADLDNATDGLGALKTGIDAVPTAVENRQEMDSNSTVLATIATDTTTDIPALIAALNDLSAADILTTALTESYAVDGAAPTLSQALMLIQQTLGDFTISGTTLTVRELDGTTVAATFTLNDGTNPTAITRTT